MNSNESNPTLIGIDWGTSSLRAYLIGAQGEILDQLNAPEGIMQVADKDFEGVLARSLDPWSKTIPLLVSGMITSRNGWLETPYLSLPAGAAQLAAGLVPVPALGERPMYFVTGVKTENDGAPDVIRGEETQIVGAVESGGVDGIYVMPGTHSKWVTVRNRSIENFATYMSGEMYAALREHTILGALMKESSFNEHGFKLGVAAGYESGAQLLHRLFHVRTLPLFGLMGEDAASDYLSGMLIGAEINGATNGQVTNTELNIVGRSDLADRYDIAFTSLGAECLRCADDIVAQGHFAIATAAGILE